MLISNLVAAGWFDVVNPKNNKHSPMISGETYEAIMNNAGQLDSAIIYERDFHYVSFSSSLHALSIDRSAR